MDFRHLDKLNAPYRHDSKTVEEAYTEGFITGLEWKHPWPPAGPYICREGRMSHPDWLEYCKLTRDRNVAWKDGFEAGRKIAS